MAIGHQIIGNGPIKVLAFHGWLGNSSVWNRAIPYLNTNDFTYAFMDFRGYGLSRNLTGKVTIEAMAKDGLELADYLGWHEFHVIGHSMGGAVAQYAGAAFKNRVQSLVALTPVCSKGLPVDEETLKGLENSFSTEGLTGIATMTIGHEMPENVVEQMVQDALATTGSEDVFKEYMHNWVKADFKDITYGSEVPALAVYGGTDPMVTKEYVEGSFGEDFVHGEITVIQEAGHYPNVEEPIRCVEIWESFINNNL